MERSQIKALCFFETSRGYHECIIISSPKQSRRYQLREAGFFSVPQIVHGRVDYDLCSCEGGSPEMILMEFLKIQKISLQARMKLQCRLDSINQS